MGLLSSLLIIVLIFYAFSMIIKLIFNHKIKKLNRQMQQDFQDESQETYKSQTDHHIDPNIGEYTDFEEIE